MPIITVSMYPGRTQEQKDEFAKTITKLAVEILTQYYHQKSII